MPTDDNDTWHRGEALEAIIEFLNHAVSIAAGEEIGLPHIVICRDRGSEDVVSYAGPFPDGISALAFAERETAVDRDHNDGPPMEYTVAALFPVDPSRG